MLLLPALTLLAAGAAPPQVWPDKPLLLHKLDNGHGTATVRGADFSPDGRTLASVCDAGVLNLWDVASGKILKTVKTGKFDHVEYSRDGKLLVTAGIDAVVRLFDATTAREVKTMKGHTGQVYVARFTPDGKHVVSCGLDNNTRVWDVETGKEVRTMASGTCYALAVSPDGKHAITAGEQRPLTLWSLSDGTKVRDVAGHTNVVVWAAFSHDGRTIASCSYDGTVRLWEMSSGKSRLSITQPNSPRAVRFAPGDRFFATVGYDASTRLYHAAGKELFADTRMTGEGYALSISRDGRHLAAGGMHGKLFLFDVSAITRKRSAGAEMAATTFDDHWKKLGSDNAVEAFESLMALSVPGALPHFSKRFEPPKPLSDEAKKRTPKLIADLAEDDEDKWRKASDELAGYGPAIVPALKAALAKETDPDVKLRLLVTIGRADVAAADQTRLLRTVESLECIGTAEAVKLVQRLAQGGHGEAVTAEAKATLARMKQ